MEEVQDLEKVTSHTHSSNFATGTVTLLVRARIGHVGRTYPAPWMISGLAPYRFV